MTSGDPEQSDQCGDGNGCVDVGLHYLSFEIRFPISPKAPQHYQLLKRFLLVPGTSPGLVNETGE